MSAPRRSREARPADNTGTLDTALLYHAAGLATADTTGIEATDVAASSYIHGWRAGSRYGLFAGLMLGASITGLALQVGVWLGGQP